MKGHGQVSVVGMWLGMGGAIMKMAGGDTGEAGWGQTVKSFVTHTGMGIFKEETNIIWFIF